MTATTLRLVLRDDNILVDVSSSSSSSDDNNNNNGDGNGDGDIPLLASTRRLLEKLRYKDGDCSAVRKPQDARNDVNDVNMDVQHTSDDNDDANKNDEDAMSVVDDDDDDNDHDADDDDEKDDANNDKKSSGKSKSETMTSSLTTPAWSQHLERCTDLPKEIRHALNDIIACKDVTVGQKRKQRKERRGRTNNHRRWQALEDQRERLQRHMSQQSSEQSKNQEQDNDDENAQDDDDGEENGIIDHDDNVVNDEEEDDDDDPTLLSTTEAWLLLVKMINSLTTLTPLLLEMLCHPDRENKSLRIGNNCQIFNRRKASAWLFGRRVFDFTTRRQVQDLWYGLRDALYSVTGDDDVLANAGEFQSAAELASVCLVDLRTAAETLLTCVNNNSHSDDSTTTMRPWMHHNPLTCLQQTDDHDNFQSLLEQAKRLDEQFQVWETAEETATLNSHRQHVLALERRLTTIFTKRFPRDHVRLRVYGSCLSGLVSSKSLTKSDVDISLELDQATKLFDDFESGSITAAQFDERRKKLVYAISRCLECDYRGEFVNMQPVAKARVPVIKGTWSGLASTPSMEFDICLFNSIAYSNSSLLREYTLVDARVKPLVRLVKQWVKDVGIGSAADGHISSYAWTNLVIFYLQAYGIVPNLQCPRLMKQLGAVPDPSNSDHCVKNLNTFFLTWHQVQTVWTAPRQLKDDPVPVTALFYGFLRFYTRVYPTRLLLISIAKGPAQPLPRTVFTKIKPFWTIEDPFETYDSHCRHDLHHANESGLPRIVRALYEAEEHMARVLLQSSSGDVSSLWPRQQLQSTSTAKPQPKKGQSNHKTQHEKKQEASRGNKQQNRLGNGGGGDRVQEKKKNGLNHKKSRLPQKGHGGSKPKVAEISHAGESRSVKNAPKNQKNTGAKGQSKKTDSTPASGAENSRDFDKMQKKVDDENDRGQQQPKKNDVDYGKARGGRGGGRGGRGGRGRGRGRGRHGGGRSRSHSHGSRKNAAVQAKATSPKDATA